MTKKVNVVKVPLPAKSQKEYTKAFPRMPILYLELIENKAKIKPELVNKDYTPTSPKQSPSKDEYTSKADSTPASPAKEEKYKETVPETEDEGPNIVFEDIDKYSERRSVEKYSSRDRESHREPESRHRESESRNRESESRNRESESRHRESHRESESRHRDSDTESDRSRDKEKERINLDSDDDYTRRKPSRKESTGSSNGSTREKKDKISYRLKELLDDDEKSPQQPKQQPQDFSNPPSLNDLAKSGQINRKKEMMDVSHITMNEQEKEDSKRELLFKFELLKKSYKTDNIPEFSIHSDYDSMKRAYESTVRTLSLDRSVEDYKKYLSYAFIGMEFVLGYFFKLDMNGFARQQMISMNSYERLLIELGEKSYVPTGSKWPVEVRLLFLVIMNTAVFLVGRMMLKKTGADVMGLMNSVTGAVPQTTIPQKKRKMKGPTLNPDDIPDIGETTSN